jgi:3-oxoacyl-[acyl-carrier-protein] synthase II
MSGRRVVVTGRAVLSPLGVGIDAHCEALASGRSAVATLADLADYGLGRGIGCRVPADLLQPQLARLPRKQLKLYNRATLLAMLGAGLAMDDAGLPPGAGDPLRFGVLIGVNVMAWELASMTQYLVESESAAQAGVLDMARANQYCMKQINPLDFSLKIQPNLVAGHVAIAQDAQAMCRALMEGTEGGLQALGQAYRLVGEGDMDVALAGGADCTLEGLLYAVSAGAGIFAADGDGPVAGEGSGVLVLEAAGRAAARGAAVRGEVLGFASSAGDGTLPGQADPARLGARIARAMRAAIEEAGAPPDVVCVDGGGAPAAEAAEARALGEALGARAEHTAVVAMKRQHGTLGSAAGAVEAAAASWFLERGTWPASARVRAGAGPGARRALVLTLGTFGECSALMLGRPGAHGG